MVTCVVSKGHTLISDQSNQSMDALDWLYDIQ